MNKIQQIVAAMAVGAIFTMPVFADDMTTTNVTDPNPMVKCKMGCDANGENCTSTEDKTKSECMEKGGKEEMSTMNNDSTSMPATDNNGATQ